MKTVMLRDLIKVGSDLDWILGSCLVAAVDLHWYGTVQRNGGNLLVLGTNVVWKVQRHGVD